MTSQTHIFWASYFYSSVKRSTSELLHMFVGDPVIMRQWPIWMHLQGPSSWMLEASSARWIFACFGKHFLFRGYIGWMWVGNNEKWLYNIWFVPVFCVCECLMFRRALQEHVCGKRFALPGCCVVHTFMRCNGPTNCARYEATTALQGAFD